MTEYLQAHGDGGVIYSGRADKLSKIHSPARGEL